MPKLFAPTSIGEVPGHDGLSIIDWRRAGQAVPLFPYADLIADYDPRLSAMRAADIAAADLERFNDQSTAEELVGGYFAEEEWHQLSLFLRDHHPAWSARFKAYTVPLPIIAADADPELLSEPEPGDTNDWVIRITTAARVAGGRAYPPLPVVGHVGRWPFGDLEAHEVSDLLPLAERLGRLTPRGTSREEPRHDRR